MGKKEKYSMKLIDHMYAYVPAFTDIFDEETFYIFVGCFVASTFILVFFISRFVTIKPVD